MMGLWLIVGFVVCGAIVARFVWRRERDFKSDMGVVSAQWINEHRLP